MDELHQLCVPASGTRSLLCARSKSERSAVKVENYIRSRPSTSVPVGSPDPDRVPEFFDLVAFTLS